MPALAYQTDFAPIETLPIPACEEPRLTGIARMAAESQDAEERNQVDYNWIDCRSVLNRVNGTRVRFEWSINPYRGCEFGCAYCYARYTHEFMELRDPMDFERKIFIKRQAAAKLARELERGACAPGETIVIGAATDPYQPAEKRFGATRAMLEVLARYSGYKIGIITKSDLILKDVDLLKKIAKRHSLEVRMTVTTTDHELARKTEPRAVTPRRRLDAVKRLNEAGVLTGVNLMPIMPGVNDELASIEGVFQGASDASAAFLGFQILFLTATTRRIYDRFIAQHFPHLAKLYEEFYRNSTDAPEFYRRNIAKKVDGLREKYGIPTSRDVIKAEPPSLGPSQGDLFAVN